MIGKLIELIKQPEVIALIVGVPVLLRAVAEFLALIGKIIPGEDFAETSSNWLKKLAGTIVKWLKFLGVGSAK